MLGEIITESRREYYYTRLYIDVVLFKKQRKQTSILLAIVAMLVGIIATLFGELGLVGVFITIFLTAVGAYVGYKYKYKQLLDLARSQDAKVSLIFPEFLQVFIGMLEVDPNGGILNALKMSIPYIKNPVKSRVIRLTHDISTDGSVYNVRRSLQDFGQYVGSSDAIQILDLINTMYMDGVDVSTLDMASEKIEELNKNTVETFVEGKRGRLRMRSLPSLVYGVVFIFIFVGIVAVEFFLGSF